MAMICPNCGSADTQALVDKSQCGACGQLIWPDGSKAEAGLDQTGTDRIKASLEKHEPDVVGNFADLQVAHAGDTVTTSKKK